MSVTFSNSQTIHADPAYTETKDVQCRHFVSTDKTMTIVAKPGKSDNTFDLVISRNKKSDVKLSCTTNQLEEIVVEYMTHHSLQKIIAT